MKFCKRIAYLLFTLPLLLISCSSAGISVPQSSLLGTLTKSGQIVYVGLDRNIYTIDQDGNNQIAITDDAVLPDQDGGTDNWRIYRNPTWAHDGTLAYASEIFFPNTVTQIAGEIYTSASDGSDRQVIFSSDTNFPFYLYWAPNSEKIGFLSTIGGDGGQMALQVAGVDEREGWVIDTGAPTYWAWSPASDYLFTHIGASGPNGADTRLTMLTPDEPVIEAGLSIPPAIFQAPEFSPDGKYVLYASQPGEGQSGRLVLANADGSSETTLALFDGIIAFDWAPSGDYVAYTTIEAADNFVERRLYFLDMSNPEFPIEINTDVENTVAFFWSPDSSQVAYFVPYQTLIAFQDEDGNDVEQVVEFMQLHVAEAKSGETRMLIEGLLLTDTFLNSVMPFFNQFQRSATIWSPDGNNLVLSVIGGGGIPIIGIVPIEGGIDPIGIAPGVIAFWSWE